MACFEHLVLGMEAILTQLKPGDLVALFYRRRGEQFAFLIPYIKQGLAQNQRCLYIADDTPVGLILNKLEEAGVDVTSAQKRGALDVLTKHETYLRSRPFQPEKMIASLHLEVQAALAKGFSGLRGSGDMCWALDDATTLAQMIDYQEQLAANFPENFLAVCQYDESRFPLPLIPRIEQLHTHILRDGGISVVRKDAAC